MNIGICLDKSDFLYDIHSLVKSFFPDDDVNIYTDGDAEKCSTARDLLLRVNIPDYTDRKTAKDRLKRELYESLSDLTGRTLPWGTLSGIRPTKIPMKMLEEGMARDEIRESIRETYLASDAKIDLAIDVALNERRILSNVPAGPDTYSLYLHVPFCPSICLYCTFSASPVSAWQKSMDDYVDAVILEMERQEMLGVLDDPGKGPVRYSAGGRKPVTFYMGGGTPTSLSPEQLDRLLTAAETYFDLSGCLERTVEAGRPDSITKEKLEVLKKHEITRISVNPQTMNQRTLDLIGRRHTVEDTVRAFELARNAGFDNINMDIILGLPGEELDDVENTLRQIEALGPDSLTVHSLAVKRASRLQQWIEQNGFSALNNTDESMRIAAEGAARMDIGRAREYRLREKRVRVPLQYPYHGGTAGNPCIRGGCLHKGALRRRTDRPSDQPQGCKDLSGAGRGQEMNGSCGLFVCGKTCAGIEKERVF